MAWRKRRRLRSENKTRFEKSSFDIEKARRSENGQTDDVTFLRPANLSAGSFVSFIPFLPPPLFF